MATVDATTATETGGGKAGGAAPSPPAARAFSGAELALRALLFAVTLAGLVVLATAKQTALVPVAVPLPQGAPRVVFLSMPAKFKDSPALIYLVVALCVTCFYSLLTALSSLKLISGSSPTKTLFLLVLLDVLYAAIMASATGSAGGVAWIGLKGNTHTNWNKICHIYDKFCRHIGSAVVMGLIASIILVLLTILNVHSLYRRSR